MRPARKGEPRSSPSNREAFFQLPGDRWLKKRMQGYVA